MGESYLYTLPVREIHRRTIESDDSPLATETRTGMRVWVEFEDSARSASEYPFPEGRNFPQMIDVFL